MNSARVGAVAAMAVFAGSAWCQATKDFNNTYPHAVSHPQQLGGASERA